MRNDSALLAVGTIGLGLVGLAFADFALQWQPVPKGVPLREPLALLSGALLIIVGALALIPHRVASGGLALAVTYGVWVVLLDLPRAAADPLNLAAWLGVAEIGSLAAAGVMILGHERQRPALVRAAQVAFGLAALVFGACHFVYADFTANMIPAWIPERLFWAWATGVAHCLAGLAILAGVQARHAASLMTAMCLSFALILHVPAIIAKPDSHAAWVMFFITVAIAGAAWTMRRAVRLR
ncbi:hypothetical protein ACFOMD_17950 [Sphingoaurantiacus capsulatus]|uniref:DoxX family membrane protein n=1 Tax=Sphingoaurantiacus capsulatus TaxID=1771310 RepID=A0ABV7XEU4_9SPHN